MNSTGIGVPLPMPPNIKALRHGHGTQSEVELRSLGCWIVFSLSGVLALAAPATQPATMPTTQPAGIAIASVAHPAPVDFQKEVLPILASNCLACHNKTKAKAGLILETPADMLKGGDTGPAIVAKKGADSLLLLAAAHQGDLVMPLKDNKVAAVELTPQQLGL